MYIQSSSSSAESESENSTTSLISANDLAQQQQPYFFSKEGSFVVHLHNRYTTTTSVCIMETVNRPPEPGDFQANRPP